MAVAYPTTMPCEPWTEPEKLCCPDVEANVPCDGGEPVEVTYSWTDDELIDIASRILFHRTCGLYPGLCTGLTLRPCGDCRCKDWDCCGCAYEFIPLAGRYPVLEVTKVRIDGAEVPGSSYRLDEFSRLVRTDGGSWPLRQNLNADPTSDPNTFLIEYSAGRAVPPDLQYAAALLACELKKACNGEDCRLPGSVRTVIREGVTYEVANISEITQGSLQIPEVDLILQGYDCSKPVMRNRLLHPLLDEQSFGGVRA